LDEAGREALVAYGVRTVIDVRTTGELELEDHPYAPPFDGVPVYAHRPFLEELNAGPRGDVLRGYFFSLDHCSGGVGAIFEAIANAEDGGVLVHCYAGKDRTGLIAALALSLAGVPDELIAEDYALSEPSLTAFFDELLRKPDLTEGERIELERGKSCPPERMMAVLSYLREKHGGPESYQLRAGLEPEAIERLRARLVE